MKKSYAVGPILLVLVFVANYYDNYPLTLFLGGGCLFSCLTSALGVHFELHEAKKKETLNVNPPKLE